MENIIIIGAGGHAKVVVDCVELEGKFRIKEIQDDNRDRRQVLHYKVTPRVLPNPAGDDRYIIAVGDNEIRKKLAEALAVDFATTIHPTAVVSKYAKIGTGTQILAGAMVNAGAVIGEHCIINTGAVIEHDCIVEDFVHVSPNCAIGGGVTIKSCTHIGIGTSMIQNINIGSNVIIGAGSSVVKDIPDNCTAVGIPAKPIKYHHPK